MSQIVNFDDLVYEQYAEINEYPPPSFIFPTLRDDQNYFENPRNNFEYPRHDSQKQKGGDNLNKFEQQECRRANLGGCQAGNIMIKSADDQTNLCCDRESAAKKIQGGGSYMGNILGGPPPVPNTMVPFSYQNESIYGVYPAPLSTPFGPQMYQRPPYKPNFYGGFYDYFTKPRNTYLNRNINNNNNFNNMMIINPMMINPNANIIPVMQRRPQQDPRDFSTWNKGECPQNFPKCVNGQCCKYDSGSNNPSDPSAQCSAMKCVCDSRVAHDRKCII